MKTPVTVVDIARRAKVSTSTVSLVVNGHFHRVSPETREKVETLVKELGYTPNRVARNLRRQDTQTIGVITAAISHSVFGEIVEVIEEAMVEEGFQVLIARAEHDFREPAVVNTMISSQVSGVIFISHSERMNNDALHNLEASGIPFIVINRWLENEPFHRVYWDNRQGMRDAVAHLAGKGHQRIAFLGNRLDAISLRHVERLEGYLDEMQRRRLPTEGLILTEGYVAAAQMTTTLLAQPLQRRPTAIVVEDDLMAAGVIGAVRSAGLSIPEDVALIGFTDREYARYLTPALTTVSLPIRDTGRQSALNLLKLIKGENEPPPEPINLKSSCQLVIRRSCGCAVG